MVSLRLGDYSTVGNEAEARAPREWFAIRVRSNRERTITSAFTARGLTAYCPTYTEETQWSDRVKTVERLLFPGYLFVHTSAPAEALRFAGVVQILPNNMIPTPIADAEIETIRTVTTAAAGARPAAIAVGETVQITRGPLAGQAGIVEKTKTGARLVVNLELLGRAVSVELAAGDVATDKAAAA